MNIPSVGKDQSFVEKAVAQAENLAHKVADLIEDLAEQVNAGNGAASSIEDSAAAQTLQQRADQLRNQLAQVFDQINPFDDGAAKTAANEKTENAVGTLPIAKDFKIDTGEPHEVGAYYHKVVTNSSRESLTLETKDAVAPQVETDNNRYLFLDIAQTKNGVVRKAVDFAKNQNGISLTEMNDASATGPKDRPSIYMGGNSGHREVDAGLAWNRVIAIKDNQSHATWTTAANGSSRTDQYIITEQGTGANKVYTATPLNGNGKPQTAQTFKPNADGSVTIGDKTLRPNFAFRPFFRSTDLKKDNGYHSKFLTPGGANDVQIYPGEKFDMSMTSAQGSNKVKLEIKTAHGNFSYEPTVSGFRGANGKGAATLKRVDSIDQKGKERGDTDATKTVVSNGAWGATTITVGKTSVPLIGSAGTHVRSPEFQRDKNEEFIFGSLGKGRSTRIDGSEQIYINPPDKK